MPTAPLITYGTSGPTSIKENLLDVLHYRTPRRNLALQMFLTNNKAWANPHIQVPYKKNFFNIGTSNAGYSDSDTTIVVAKDSKTPILPKVNQEYYVPSTGEIFTSSSSSGDITDGASTISFANVTRGARSTTAAAIASGATIVAGPHIVGETDDFSTTDSDHVTSTRQSYYTQIFEAPLKLSGTALAIANQAVNQDLDEAGQTNLILDKLENVDLLQAAFRGVHGSSTVNTTTGIGDNRRLSGIIPTISRLGSANNVINASSNLTTGVFDDVLRQIVDLEGGADPSITQGQNPVGSAASYVAFMNAKTKNAVNILDAASRRRDQNDTKIVNFVETYVGPIAVDFVVVPNYALFDGEIVIVQKGQYILAPLQNSAFKKDKLAKTSRGEKFGISGEYGGILMYPDTAFYIQNAI